MTDAPAVVATQSFSGVTVAEASEPSFQAALAGAVADELGVDADDVTITSTAASPSGDDVVVQYAVTGDSRFLATYTSTRTYTSLLVKDTVADDSTALWTNRFALLTLVLFLSGISTKKTKAAKKTLETRTTAIAIEDALQDEGYKNADVDEASAEVTTVSTEPAVVATQSFSGVTVDEASEPAFETALAAAVADELGVDADDVTITSTAASGDDVVVQYTVTGDPPFLATNLSTRTHTPLFYKYSVIGDSTAFGTSRAPPCPNPALP